MKINPNINLRDRSKVTLKDFKGLDTLSSSVNVSAIHASEMQNFVSRDGVNHKRHGWKQQLEMVDTGVLKTGQKQPIRGIFNFNIYGIDFLLVYMARSFFVVDLEKQRYDCINVMGLKDGKTFSGQIVEKAPVNSALLTDTECKCFLNGDKAYFVGCGDYLVFSKWQNGYFELRRVVGNEDVYIPTTTENISCQEDLETGVSIKRITAEERNLLSSYSKNLLIGKKLTYTSAEEYEVATYYLDQKNFIDLELSVKHKDGSITQMKRMNNDLVFCLAGSKVLTTNVLETQITSELTGEVNSSYGDAGTVALIREKTKEVVVAIFENAAKLIFECKLSNDSYSLINKTYVVDGVNISFNPPEQFYCQLYYVKDEKIKIGQELTGYLTYNITSATSLNFTFDMTMIFPAFELDLSEYNAVLSSDYSLDEYKFRIVDQDAFVIKDKTENAQADVYPSQGVIIIYPYTVEMEGGDTGGDAGGGGGSIPYALVPAGKTQEEGNEDFFTGLTKDDPNITVTMSFANDGNSSLILSSSKGVKFGLGGKDDRLFIVDATGYNLRWSKDLDFTYFGDKSFNNCGTSDANITGMERLNDSTLMVVKEYSPQEPSIYVITGTFTSSKTEAGTEDYAALFTPKGYSVGMGAVGQLVNFNGECLMVAKDGLYSIAIGENMTIDSRYILHRSRQISNTLEKFDLARAKCVSFNGRLYVCVGGDLNECFVADSKYATSFGDDAQNVISYEWWRWTNIPVCTWGFVNNELWFGTEDGKLCSFSKEFYDEKFDILSRGDIGYVMNNDSSAAKGFVFNKSYGAKPGDYIRFACDMFGSVEVKDFEVVGDETRLYLPLKEYEDGEIVYISGVGYQITKHDTYISIPIKYDAEGLEIYKNHKGILLEIEQVFSDGVTIVKTVSGKYPLWLPPGEINPIGYDLVASLIRRTTVVAKWVTGAMDLGTTVYSKTITYLILTGEKSLTNNLKYGIRTRFTKKDYQDELFRANNDINLSLLDFQSLSLDFGFASSYTKKLNIRDVNFVMFYFVSDTEDDIALNSVQIEFKLHKRNIGVR